jgi:hypothetical protein
MPKNKRACGLIEVVAADALNGRARLLRPAADQSEKGTSTGRLNQIVRRKKEFACPVSM